VVGNIQYDGPRTRTKKGPAGRLVKMARDQALQRNKETRCQRAGTSIQGRCMDVGARSDHRGRLHEPRDLGWRGPFKFEKTRAKPEKTR